MSVLLVRFAASLPAGMVVEVAVPVSAPLVPGPGVAKTVLPRSSVIATVIKSLAVPPWNASQFNVNAFVGLTVCVAAKLDTCGAFGWAIVVGSVTVPCRLLGVPVILYT